MATSARLGWAAALLTAITAPAIAEDAAQPLSAIDWLSKSVASPAAAISEVPVTGGVSPAQSITTTILGGPSIDAVGLLPPSKTGFPRALWGTALAGDVAGAIAGLQTASLPALHDLTVKLLIAEADAPDLRDASKKGAVLLARIDKLLEMGALDQAYALIEAAGPATNAEVFRRAFDASLLMGEEDRACREMRATRGLDIAAPARIFCAARAGDWSGAQLTLTTETALGRIDAHRAEMLGRFLDPDAFDDPALPLPQPPITPLIWRIYDALGGALPTGQLPIAFAYADLSPRAGWKAQAEAAERLARAGVLSPNQLLGIFTQQKPAASGGIWDRVAAFQAFDAAMSAKDAAQMAQTLPAAYSAMSAAELEVPFAALYGEALAAMGLAGAAGDIAFELGLLSPAYETVAQNRGDKNPFLAGLAQGKTGAQTGAQTVGALARAVEAGFTTPAPQMNAAASVGMAILTAISRIQAGIFGEMRALSEGLAMLRALGLESAARRIALELMILERRG